MLLSEARSIVERISNHFNIEVPEVQYTKWKPGRTHTSFYRPHKHEIHLSRDFCESSVIHEISHGVQHKGRGGRQHDYIFWNTLFEVTEYYYGDFTKYAWSREYPRGRKFFKNKLKKLNRRNVMEKFELLDTVEKPVKKSSYPFEGIKVGGGIKAFPDEGQTLEKLATKVRNAVNNFKKGHDTWDLSVSVRKAENYVLVYRDADAVTAPAVPVTPDAGN